MAKVPKYPYDSKDTIKVKGYTRKKSNPKPDPEDGTGLEMQNVAPQAGPKIVSVPKPGQPKQSAVRKGVTILGGAPAGRMGGLNVRPKQ